MIRKLRIKFVLINMVIVTAMLAAMFSLVIFFMGIGLELQGQRSMQELTKSVLHPGQENDPPVEVRRPHFVIRMDADGRIVSVDNGFFEEPEQQVLHRYAALALEQDTPNGVLSDHKLRFQIHEFPWGKVLIFADISGEMTAMANLIQICLLISGISFCAFFLISVLLAQWAVKPVEEAWNRQKQFVADASHELKTPLTVIMTNAELLQSSNLGNDEIGKFSGSILTMSRQMRGLVESLLELARVDNGAVKMALSRVELSELVEHSLLPFEPVYFEKGLLLQSDVEPGLWIRGSQSHLRQVADILLDNAAKYTVPGACVTVRLRRQGRDCLLMVENPGMPMNPEELKNIFKRFYRADKARAMNHSYGLGLSIAERIVSEHGGRIWAESREGVNTFFVALPQA